MYKAANHGAISHVELLKTIDETILADIEVTVCGLSSNPSLLAANAGFHHGHEKNPVADA